MKLLRFMDNQRATKVSNISEDYIGRAKDTDEQRHSYFSYCKYSYAQSKTRTIHPIESLDNAYYAVPYRALLRPVPPLTYPIRSTLPAPFPHKANGQGFQMVSAGYPLIEYIPTTP